MSFFSGVSQGLASGSAYLERKAEADQRAKEEAQRMAMESAHFYAEQDRLQRESDRNYELAKKAAIARNRENGLDPNGNPLPAPKWTGQAAQERPNNKTKGGPATIDDQINLHLARMAQAYAAGNSYIGDLEKGQAEALIAKKTTDTKDLKITEGDIPLAQARAQQQMASAAELRDRPSRLREIAKGHDDAAIARATAEIQGRWAVALANNASRESIASNRDATSRANAAGRDATSRANNTANNQRAIQLGELTDATKRDIAQYQGQDRIAVAQIAGAYRLTGLSIEDATKKAIAEYRERSAYYRQAMKPVNPTYVAPGMGAPPAGSTDAYGGMPQFPAGGGAAGAGPTINYYFGPGGPGGPQQNPVMPDSRPSSPTRPQGNAGGNDPVVAQKVQGARNAMKAGLSAQAIREQLGGMVQRKEITPQQATEIARQLNLPIQPPPVPQPGVPLGPLAPGGLTLPPPRQTSQAGGPASPFSQA